MCNLCGMPQSDGKSATVVLTVRLPRAMVDRLNRAAESEGMRRSDWIRDALLTAARRSETEARDRAWLEERRTRPTTVAAERLRRAMDDPETPRRSARAKAAAKRAGGAK